MSLRLDSWNIMKKKIPYHILKPARHKIKIQRSTFIGSVASVAAVQEAELFIQNIRKEFYKATHNCFAYRIDRDQFRFSDDGEPSGAAGRPILTVLEKFNLEGTALVVTRFFGGVKLGAGGLRRAYAQCAEETVQQAGVKEVIPQRQMTILYPYDAADTVQHLVEKHEGTIEGRDYRADGSVEATVRMPDTHSPHCIREILSLGNKKIEFIER